MSSITPAENNSNNFNSNFSLSSTLNQGLQSGAVGALITPTVIRSIYKKDMVQINQNNLIRVDSLKSSWLFAAANFPKMGTQAIFYNLFRSTSKGSEQTKFTFSNELACSAGAGLFSAIFYTSFENTALNLHKKDQKMSVHEIVKKLFHNRKLQQGLMATAIRDVKFVCIYNTAAPTICNDVNKKIEFLHLKDDTSKFASTVIGSSVVGALGGIAQTPADALRAARQQTALNDGSTTSYLHSAKRLGLKGLMASWPTKASIGARAVPLIVLANEYLLQSSRNA